MSDIYGFSAPAAAFAENRSCAAVYVDISGTIRSWNRAAEILFGHSAAEAIGRRADLIVPEALRAMHWAGFDRAVQSPWPGSSAWGPIEPLHRDGHLLALEVFLVALHTASPTPAGGLLALFRVPAGGAAAAA
jgi:PAS domain S-box-containing protein